MPLPERIRALAENGPVEDFLLDLLRAELPEIPVQSAIEFDQTFPFILVRRIPGMGEGAGDPRFLDSATASVQTFCDGVDADSDSAVLQEAIRVTLRDAWLSNRIVPGRGHLTRMDTVQAARRATDWSTSVGPVQYADLPAGVLRFEAQYQLTIRRHLAR